MGWTLIGKPVPEPKCIILGAPHTSMWDFVISYLYYTAIGGKAGIFIKSEIFKGPLKPILLKLGGIPVNRGKGTAFVKHMIDAVRNMEHVHLAIAPEGTRQATKKWKAGFHTLAKTLDIPVYIGYFDWGTKEIGIGPRIEITDNAQKDIQRIKQWYIEKGVVGKHPALFDPF
ncbi:MAG: 1-acyl-sn-glycerol-3-phosphate acyltransferase [Bacteroidales bacterium]